ncbi:MAG: glycosyltransferase family 1 protein [Patescibacteria group bacterium]
MNIAIDLTPLQGPHLQRGVGQTLLNFLRNIDSQHKESHHFIFYLYEDNSDDVNNTINEQMFSSVEIRYITEISKPKKPSNKILKIFYFAWLVLALPLKQHKGDPRLGGKELSDVDFFFQFDQNQPLPKKRKVKSVLIAYDIIPYVLECDYLKSYSTVRRDGASRREAIKSSLKRWAYLQSLKINTRRAQKVLAISQHTKNDFMMYVKVPQKKIEVCLLGINPIINGSVCKDSQKVDRYVYTSWGSLPKKSSLPKKPFLLFVGGVDPRRKLVDLISAYNGLRAQGKEIALVLCGDTMLGWDKIPNTEVRDYLKHTSYLDDIYFLGFAEDSVKNWLYKNAVAFVYPSVYEGFGLPVLEAMQYSTPVITYKNSSIGEIAGSAAIYTHDGSSIKKSVEDLLTSTPARGKYKAMGEKQASRYLWSKTTNNTFKELLS